MRPFVVIAVILTVIAAAKLAHHYAWLRSPATPYVLENITAMTGEGKIILGQKININTATASELEALPGIGPVLAVRIVEYREGRRTTDNGRNRAAFASPDDLLNVRGIGPATLAKIRPFIK